MRAQSCTYDNKLFCICCCQIPWCQGGWVDPQRTHRLLIRTRLFQVSFFSPSLNSHNKSKDPHILFLLRWKMVIISRLIFQVIAVQKGTYDVQSTGWQEDGVQRVPRSPSISNLVSTTGLKSSPLPKADAPSPVAMCIQNWSQTRLETRILQDRVSHLNQAEKKGGMTLHHITVHQRKSGQELKHGRNPEAGADGMAEPMPEAMEGVLLTACLRWLAHPPFL